METQECVREIFRMIDPEHWSGPDGAAQGWRKWRKTSDAGIAMLFLTALIIGAIIASFYGRVYYP